MHHCPIPPLLTAPRRTFRRPVLSADPAEVPAARAWIARTLFPTDRSDDIVLVADELLANAVQHAPAPAGGVVAVLALEETPTAHVALVWSRRSAATVPGPRRPAAEDEHGRGLALVAAAADDWGCYPAEEWVAVWARFATGGGRR